MKRLSPAQRSLYITYFFIFVIFIDALLVFLYTVTQNALATKLLFYGSEFAVLAICMFLLLKSLFAGHRGVQLPVFVYFYAFYILLMSLLSFLYADSYGVLRDMRKFLAPLPPLVIGFYFAAHFKDDRQKYLLRLVKLLTVISAIGLFEWTCWYVLPSVLESFNSKFFRAGSYYTDIKSSSGTTEEGTLLSALRPSGFIIPTLTRRQTGLYLEPFSAGFNAVLAIILIWYSRIAGFARIRKDSVLLLINFVAVVLTTSRAAYLFLLIALCVYRVVQRKYLSSLLWATTTAVLCVLYYNPIAEAVSSVNWTAHKDATMSFVGYFLSFNNLLGEGIGVMERSAIYTDCGYGAIYGQLGIVGIVGIIIFYICLKRRVYPTRENFFFVTTIIISIFALLFFAGFIFGYKTFGLIHLCLGFLMGCGISRRANKYAHSIASERYLASSLGRNIATENSF